MLSATRAVGGERDYFEHRIHDKTLEMGV